jgi:CheY-like chemotaxis protein
MSKPLEKGVLGLQSRKQASILLVDDQPGKLLSYEVILADIGANLVTARSAREALEHLLKNEFAVVIVDVCMPDLDGFELAEMIRGSGRRRSSSCPACICRIWIGLRATSAEPSITCRCRSSPRSCAPRCRCSWICI